MNILIKIYKYVNCKSISTNSNNLINFIIFKLIKLFDMIAIK